MDFLAPILLCFLQKKTEKRPRSFGLFGSVFGRSGPGKNGSVRAVFKDRTEDRPITSTNIRSSIVVPIDFYFEDIQIPNANQLIGILKIFKAQKGRAYWFPHKDKKKFLMTKNIFLRESIGN